MNEHYTPWLTLAVLGTVATATVIGGIVYLFLKLLLFYGRHKKIWDAASQFPGHKRSIFMGHLHEVPRDSGRLLLKYLMDWVDEYKTAYCFWMGPFKATIQVIHPDTVRSIITTSEPKPLTGVGDYKIVQPWIGNGLITSGGDHWFRNRRLLTPAFHFDVLKPYLKIYNEAADLLLNKWMNKCTAGSVEIYGDVTLCSLNIILRCAFSYDEDIQGDEGNEYATAVEKITTSCMEKFFMNPIYMMSDFLYGLTKHGQEFYRNCEFVHKVAEDIIANRKRVLKENPDIAKSRRYIDFLDILLSARDEDGNGLADAEIRQEVDTFLFAGHDTTTSAISWVLYSLAKNPEHQEKVRQEVEALLSDRQDELLQWQDLSKLEHMTMCIKESMRLHTTVPFIARILTKELIIDGKTLPPGSHVEIDIYGLHHNRHVWGDDVYEYMYRPDRFLPENRKTMDSFAFIPFSAGPRNCIGQNFAMNEIKVIIARVLHKFDLEVDLDHEVEPKVTLVMRSKNGLRLKIKPRY